MVVIVYMGYQAALDSPRVSFKETVKWGHKNGFQCVATVVREPASAIKRSAEVKGILRREGMFISAVNARSNHLDPDHAKRERRREFLKKAMDLGQELGVPNVVTYAGSTAGMYWYGIPTGTLKPRLKPLGEGEKCLELFAAEFGPLADYAEDRDVKIAFDNAVRAGTGNIAHNPEMWDKMFATVPSRALGLSFDPSHLVWLHIGPIDDIIREYGERIYHFEAKDAEIIPAMLRYQGILGNRWWRYRVPGFGDIDWRKVTSSLKDIGYDYALSIENEDPLYPGPEGILIAKNFLMSLVGPTLSTRGLP